MRAKLLRLLPLAAVIVALITTVLADPVGATNTQGTLAKWDEYGPNPNVFGRKFALPTSFPSGDSTYVVVNVGAFMTLVPDGDDGTLNWNFMLGFDGTAAGDSVDTQIFNGLTSSGPWISVSALTKEDIGGLTAAAPFDVVNGVKGLAGTFGLGPYWKILVKSKGSTLASKNYYAAWHRGPGRN